MKKIKKTFDSTYGMTHEKFVRMVGNMRHFQNKQIAEPDNKIIENKAAFYEREVDEYVRDYMKPIIEDNKSRGIK